MIESYKPNAQCFRVVTYVEQDNIVFFKELAEHEKIPKGLLRKFQVESCDPAKIPLSVKKHKLVNVNIRTAGHFKSVKRRFTKDGKKICKCGSLSHKNTLHRWVLARA